MTHKDIGAVRHFASGASVQKCGNFDKGTVLCKYDRELCAGQSPYIKNMIYDRNMLRTRFGREYMDFDEAMVGELHGCCEEGFFGYRVFHVGNGLFAFDGTVLRKIYDGMPDCDSFMFEMNSLLYIFCSEVKIFILDSKLSLNEHIIEDTKLMKDAKFNLDTYTELEVPDNMIMYRVCVDYLARDVGTTYYNIPLECDEDYPIIFTSLSSGNTLDVTYTVDGTRIQLGREISVACNVSYVPKRGTRYRNFDKIFGCRKTCTYGGNSSGGTRVFFSGNDDYPGYYFFSELLSPLHVKTLSYDILGNGSEKITCLAKQKGELVVFCEKSIYKMMYSFDPDSGADFIISEISTKIGCDVPQSVRLIDNRLVFADSASGIYIIVSSEYTDELSIRRISGNINGNSGDGFLFENKDEVKKSISVDFGRRYIIACPSGNAYVWDYGNSSYVVSDDPLSSERRLSWYLFDGFYESVLFEMGEGLFGAVSKGGNVELVRFGDDCNGDFGSDILCIYKSREFDNGNEFVKKVATDLYLDATGTDRTNLIIYVFAGETPVLFENYVFVGRDEDGEKLKHLRLKTAGFASEAFSFMIVCLSGKVGLRSAAIRFNTGKAY